MYTFYEYLKDHTEELAGKELEDVPALLLKDLWTTYGENYIEYCKINELEYEYID